MGNIVVKFSMWSRNVVTLAAVSGLAGMTVAGPAVAATSSEGGSTSSSERKVAPTGSLHAVGNRLVDKGDRTHLPGLHNKGVRVLRAHGPKIRKMTLQVKGSEASLTVPIQTSPTLRGTAAVLRKAKATEKLRIQVRVAEAVTDTQRQKYRYVKSYMRTLDDRRGRTSVTLAFPHSVAKRLANMSAARRADVVSVAARQLIDVNGDRIADHVKGAETTLGSSAGKLQGQGIDLAVSNNTAESITLIGNAGACMKLNGDDGSSLSPFQTTLQPGQSVEQYLEADAGIFDTPEYQGFDATALGESILEDAGSDAAKSYLNIADVTPAGLAASAAELAIGDALKNCSDQPSVFAMMANDSVGNFSNQGYVISNNADDLLTGTDNGLVDLMDAIDTLALTNWEGSIVNSDSTNQVLGIFSTSTIDGANYVPYGLETNGAPGSPQVYGSGGGDNGLAFNATSLGGTSFQLAVEYNSSGFACSSSTTSASNSNDWTTSPAQACPAGPGTGLDLPPAIGIDPVTVTLQPGFLSWDGTITDNLGELSSCTASSSFCSATYHSGMTVTLTASSQPGVYVEWPSFTGCAPSYSGADSGGTCTFEAPSSPTTGTFNFYDLSSTGF